MRVFGSFHDAIATVAADAGVSEVDARNFLFMARAIGMAKWHDAPKYGAGTGDLSEPQCGELIR